MALSNKERELYKKKGELLDSLLNLSNNIEVDSIKRVNESSNKKIRDLNDLQKVLEGKNLFQLKLGSFDSGISNSSSRDSADVIISLMFLSNKNKTVSKDDNMLSLAFCSRKNYDGEVKSLEVYEGGKSAELVDFMELPDGEGYEAENTAQDFVDMCDADEIYQLYRDVALKTVREAMPTAYQMFKGPNIVERCSRNYSGISVTLFVTYDTRLGKFIYCYNPDFILKSAIDEYVMFKDRYSSLASCYIYLLAFFITHEMMHIVTNNTSSGGQITGMEKGNHNIENIVMDSFINCNLSILFKRADGIKIEDNLAPFPYTAYKSKVSLRGEHNVGFKRYENTRQFAEELANLYLNVISEDIEIHHHEDDKRDLTKYEGADVIFHLDVSPRAQAIRKSSMTYQKFVNDAVNMITDGNIYLANTQFSDKEKIGDQNILPNGTLVRIKNSTIICIIKDYDDSGKVGIYTLDNTESTINRSDNGDGTYKCSYTYSDDGTEYGKLNRSGFVLFNKDSYENTWIEGAQKQEKKKLDDEDIQKAKSAPNNIIDLFIRDYGIEDFSAQLMAILKVVFSKSEIEARNLIDVATKECTGLSVSDCKKKIGSDVYDEIVKAYNKFKSAEEESNENPIPPIGGNMGQNPPKSFNVGDIVFVRTIGKFGRIISMNNGKFELEEMKEQEARVLDDSNFVR